MPNPKTAILLIDCPDRKGIVVTIINFLVNRYDVNILNADQHQDVEAALFFMRVEFATDAPSFAESAFRTGRVRFLNGAARVMDSAAQREMR
jgi:formyltetrahydrofolate deformylase